MKLNISIAFSSAAGIMMMAASLPWTVTAFVAHPTHHHTRAQIPSGTTTLNLEDHIADMIDGEVSRLNHKDEAEADWIMKQQQWSRMEPKLPANFEFEEELLTPPTNTPGPVLGFTSGVDRSKNSPRRRKDERMAEDDPMRYCADRCVATGNCDVFEDMFEMGPREVMKFCTECVLSEDEEPCDIPETVFGGDDSVGEQNEGAGGLKNPSLSSGLQP